MLNSILHPHTEKVYTYNQLAKCIVLIQDKHVWNTSLANEIRRLVDGVGTRMLSGTNTIKFITNATVSRDRDATYGKIICDIHLQKKETH